MLKSPGSDVLALLPSVRTCVRTRVCIDSTDLGRLVPLCETLPPRFLLTQSGEPTQPPVVALTVNVKIASPAADQPCSHTPDYNVFTPDRR